MRAQALAPWLGCAGSGLGWWIGGGARGTPPGSGVAAGSRPGGAGDGVVEDLRAAESSPRPGMGVLELASLARVE